MVPSMKAVLFIGGFLVWLIVMVDWHTGRRLPLPVTLVGSCGMLVAILAAVYLD